MIGEQIEHYRIDALEGRGGLGTVYRAFDTNLIRPVALKLIDPAFAADPVYQAHIMQMAKSAAKLTHPNIATIYNFGNKNHKLYLVSEYVLGFDLKHLIDEIKQQNQSIHLSDLLLLLAEIGDGLAYAHQHGVLHRNLKPSNVLLKPLETAARRSNQPSVRPLLTDFGLTQHIDGDVKSSQKTLGDVLHYMSPEHCLGNPLDARSDIYVFGLLMYELFSGKRPFQIHSAAEAMIMHTLETPPALEEIRPALPQPIVTIVERALAKSPAKRHQDMLTLAELLRKTAVAIQEIDQPDQLSIRALLNKNTPPHPEERATRPHPIPGFSIGVLPIPDTDLVKVLREALQGEIEPDPKPDLKTPTRLIENKGQKTPALSSTPVQESPSAQLLAQQDQVVIQRPGYNPRAVRLDKEILTIGRSRDNDIVLEASDVSRKHAQLEKTSAGWRVVDLHSLGGTYWGGHKLLPDVPESWNSNQSLRIGPYSLRWQPAEAPRPFRLNEADDENQITKLHAVPSDGTQTSSTQGGFSLMVNPVLMRIAPGEHGIIQVELFNHNPVADHFTLRLADLPPMLATFSQNSVFLNPGERATLPITISIPDENPISAGAHPFQIIVRRGSEQADSATVSARLTVGSAENFSMGVWPLELTPGGICQVLIRNEGNTNGRFSLTGHSADPNLTFLGERGQIRVEPGQAATLSMTVSTEKRPLFGRRQHLPFDIQVRSETGQEKVENGRLAVDPRLPAWILPVAEIFIVLIFIGVALSSYFSNNQIDALGQGGEFDFELGEEQGDLPVGEFTPQPTVASAEATAAFADDDGDGLTNADEFSFGTDLANPDSDGDGLSDGEEVGLYDTSPTSSDTDGDGLSDGEEIKIYQTDPTLADTDLDGVSDGDEVKNGTDPLRFPPQSNNPIGPLPTSAPNVNPTTPALNPTALPTQPPAQSTVVPTQMPPTQPPAQSTNTPISTAVATNTPPGIQTSIQPPLADSGTGWVSLSGQLSSGIANLIRAGDSDQGDTIRGYLSYDLSQIPDNAEILSARLTFNADSTTEGNPFVELDCLLIEAVEYDLPLDPQDYEAFAFYIDCLAGPPSAIDVLIDVQDAIDFQLGYLQLRFSFSDDTDFDTEADQFVIRSAPTLDVTFASP